MARLHLNLLGTYQATLDGSPITSFESDKVRALLAYLAVECNRSHRREILAGLLWPDMAERDARTNLRQVLSNLRKGLGDRESDNPFLLINRQTIQFNRNSDYELDVKDFTDAIAATVRHSHANLEDCELCVSRLSEAAELYKGDFLNGFSLPSDLFEEWVVVQREKLHIQVLDVLDHLTAHHECKREYQAAQRYAQRQVELEPWRESAHRQLMRANAFSGQRGMALAQYETCQRILETELSIEPELETTTLYQRILSGELLPEPSDTSTAQVLEPDSPQAMPQNLPTSLIPFVGREKLLDQITTRLCNPEYRLLTLVGPGGSGKTRLALEAARSLLAENERECFADGMYFVSLSAVIDIESVVSGIAQAVGFSFYGEGEAQAQLLSYLKRKKLLLILDNFEHLARDAGLIDEMLRTAPCINVLVTSRVRLNLRVEQRIPVPGMDYPSSVTDLAAVSRHSAVQLFIQCAHRVQPDFMLDADNAADVVRVCQQVHGMPLGILLATAWLHMLAPVEIADEIERSLDFLEMDWPAVPIRQRSMRAVFDHSWRLLSEREREIVRGMSVFRGGCTEEAVHAVTGASLRDLLGLINKSQLHRTPGGRYEMHELLRQYTAERLSQQPGKKMEIYERHSDYYANNLARWEEEIKSPRQRSAISEITLELENTRLAVDWMLTNAKIRKLEKALGCLASFYEIANRFQDGVAITEMIAKNESKVLSDAGLRLRVQALAWQIYFTEQTGNIELAFQLIENNQIILGLSGVLTNGPQDYELPTSVDDQKVRALSMWAVGMCFFQPDLMKTRSLFEQSLALYRQLDDRWSTAEMLRFVANIFYKTGEMIETERLLLEAVTIYKELGDTNRVVNTLRWLGFYFLVYGRVEEGESILKQAMIIAEDTGIGLGLGVFGLSPLHAVNVNKGNFIQAREGYESEYTRYKEFGIRMRLMENICSISFCDIHLGNYETAQALLLDCLAQCRDWGYTFRIASCYEALGHISLALGDYKHAQINYEQYVNCMRKSGRKYMNIVGLGFAARGAGHFYQARNQFHQALQTEIGAQNLVRLYTIIPGIALLLSSLGEPERAVELYALASTNPYVANSCWFEDVVGKHIAKVAESLPSKVVAAARERGRTRDLWETAEELLAEFEGEAHIE